MMKELLLLWRKKVSADVYLYIKVGTNQSVAAVLTVAIVIKLL